jgi:hypothetical protein
MSTIVEEKEILDVLRSEINKAGGPVVWAQKHRLNRSVVSRVFYGRQPITLSIAKALKLRRVYIRD